ncbi:KAP family NTPase [Clostridium sporogenes]|uniref:KAP family NTPase n=1 Tax=Clostridium sporogenes TaxID=1509 RepID=UPI002238030A|nr:KAP family NTPase [Clostridium sporogenes]MCW6076764.1 KAP family NTPase [Clostridium sporogenes]MCW6076767.1 KAP family NTPase [Clostridium sporogenes]
MSTIKSILNDNCKDKVCIFIDEQWGIGKTYTINKFIDNSEEKISLKYVSVFGKDNLKDIIIQLLLGSGINKNNLLKKFKNNNGSKIVGNLLSDVIKQFTGVDSNFIRNISVENVTNEENSIICIDDLERKSEKIDINDLLGLIERATANFNIIIIANSFQFTKEESNSFNRFKEKVIDYELVVDELSDETLREILEEKFGGLEREIQYKIVETFKRNTTSLNNLRIYKKYINLICKVNSEINIILNSKRFKVDDKMIELCNRVVVENYNDFHGNKKN